MELLKPGPFARCLEEQREYFNNLYTVARRTRRNLDKEIFGRHLIEVVAPLVDGAAKSRPDCARRLSNDLYELSLELVSRKYLGVANRYPAVDILWRKALPKLIKFLPEGGRDFVAALSNAVYNLEITPNVTPATWLKALLQVADGCSTWHELLLAGKVLAWRCGMAHYRESAIEVWRSMHKELKLATLGLLQEEEEISLDLLEKSLADPWWLPGVKKGTNYELEIVGTVGGFQGFGGTFLTPPEVMKAGEDIYAFDDEACWSVHADCYGVTLQRFGRTLPDGEQTDGPFNITPKSGNVTLGKTNKVFSTLKRATGFASTSSCLAVTVPSSHKVFIVANVPKSN